MIDVYNLLKSKAEIEYAGFTKKLVPDTNYPILGVRVPIIREIAKELVKNYTDAEKCIKSKHTYYEEYFVCAVAIAYLKCDNIKKIEFLKWFLPFIDNWAICDSLSSTLKCVKKDRSLYFDFLKDCLKSNKTYTVRFGLVCLMDYFLDDEYIDRILQLIKNVKSNEYYINMALAWLVSFALVNNYNKTVVLLENKTFTPFVQNKSIQKAKESFRIDKKIKNYLDGLKIK